MRKMAGEKANRQRDNYMAVAGVMLAFIIFALCAVSMLLYSAAFCQKISQRGELAWKERTCGQYLEWKVKQMDAAGCIAAGSIGGEDALVLTETIEGEDYSTWIYCSGGWMREYFTETSRKPDPDSGTEILEADQMRISQEGNLLTIKTDLPDGRQVCTDICIHSGEEKTE